MPADQDVNVHNGSPAPSILLEHREWLRNALSSVAVAVITTDVNGGVTLLNPVAEMLTGWTQTAATSIPVATVYHAVDEITRKPGESPEVRVLRQEAISGRADQCLLIARDGTERTIIEYATPIRDHAGKFAGALLLFCDFTQRGQHDRAIEDALVYSQEIVATLREPFLVLDKNLRVAAANAAFYRIFHTSESDTLAHFVYDLGNGQWDIPALRHLLETAIPQRIAVNDFSVDHHFPQIGRRTMLLNARRFPPNGGHASHILLAIEDVTERERSQSDLRDSELRFRRLFQTAQGRHLDPRHHHRNHHRSQPLHVRLTRL